MHATGEDADDLLDLVGGCDPDAIVALRDQPKAFQMLVHRRAASMHKDDPMRDRSMQMHDRPVQIVQLFTRLNRSAAELDDQRPPLRRT